MSHNNQERRRGHNNHHHHHNNKTMWRNREEGENDASLSAASRAGSSCGSDGDGDSCTNTTSLGSDGDTCSRSCRSEDEDDIPTDRVGKMCYQMATNDVTLTEIDLDLEDLDSIRLQNDTKELLAGNKSLKKVSLSCNCASPHQDELLRRNFKSFCTGLARNTSIKTFQLKDLDLCRESAFLLGSSLAHNPRLKRIGLHNCEMKESGLAVLFLGLQHNPRIEELTIWNCTLTDQNADIVAASLQFLKLKSIALINANLTKEALLFLCDMMENTPSLTQINLSQNKLLGGNTACLESLCSVLQSSHQKIERLILSDCGLDDSGVTKLAKSLRHNTTIASINLTRNNNFGSKGASSLKNLCEKNHSVKELTLEGCDGLNASSKCSKPKQAIASALRYNNSLLKSLFSATTSLAIFESVDYIESLA